MLLALNKTRRTREGDIDVMGSDGLKTLVKTWSTGGAFTGVNDNNMTAADGGESIFDVIDSDGKRRTRITFRDRLVAMAARREAKRIAKIKQRALKEAAKVVVDYRPVMSAIINDYLFRCPSWHFAQLLTRDRSRKRHENNVYVYRFSFPTHIPGYKECWGKSCHTAELPYVFQSMDVIRSNYSTIGPYAQEEAPSAPEYPYTQIMAAYRGALEAIEHFDESDVETEYEKQTDGNGMALGRHRNHTKAFQRILNHFFGDYFKEDADEEMASDMSERWASFARSSNPNYDSSKAKWAPWRHESEISNFLNDGEGRGDWTKDTSTSLWLDEEYDLWTDDEEYDEFSDSEEFIGSREEYYRQMALEALEMDVAAEDVFTTELRRVKYRKEIEDEDVSFLGGRVLKRLYHSDDRPIHLMSKSRAKEAVRLAQEFGLLGMGLSEDEAGKGFPMDEGEIFFPELFEFTWPPEGRLIERDCTCDLWDRIRYRY